MKDLSPLLCIFCSVLKRTTHQEANKAGLLSGIVRAVIISHHSINQPTDQHHFPPALETAPANRVPLATGTAPGDPQPGLPGIRDRFGQTTVLSQGTGPWRLQSKECLGSCTRDGSLHIQGLLQALWKINPFLFLFPKTPAAISAKYH